MVPVSAATVPEGNGLVADVQALVDGLPIGVWTLRILTAHGQVWQATAATVEGWQREVRVE